MASREQIQALQAGWANGPRQLTETREEQIARWEADGLMDPDCKGCQTYYYAVAIRPSEVFAPRHKASVRCESGRHPHCTCDTCW